MAYHGLGWTMDMVLVAEEFLHIFIIFWHLGMMWDSVGLGLVAAGDQEALTIAACASRQAF